MYREIVCARCGKTLEFVKQENLQFGAEGMFLDRDYSKGHMRIDIYVCPDCGEYHFFRVEPCEKEKLIKCKWCCHMVDPSYPHCPDCGHDPNKW